MNRQIAFVFGLALLIAGGVFHGVYAERWRKSSALEDAVALLPAVPASFDGWTSEEQKSDAAEFAQAGAEGYWSRMYRRDGKEFLVILMVGRSGRMSVHTPEVCYRGAGFDLAGKSTQYLARNLQGRELGAFWTATFVKPGAASTELQLSWSWNDGGAWSAPQSPRWAFAGQPALYKLYLSQNVSSLPPEAALKSRAEFLRDFVPRLNEALGLKSP